MGELDDALAGLRSEALAAASTDFERVRAARRRYLARRATTAALAVAVVVGGGAIAAANTGFLGADGNRDGVLVNPTPTDSPQPTQSASESGTPLPVPSITDRPHVPGQTEWTSLALLGKAGTLLGRRCDGDGIKCDIVVRATGDGARTFAPPVLVAKAVFDPDVQSAADHTATSAVETSRGTWLFGASLFYSDDRAHWTEVPLTGVVRAVLSDASTTVAIIEQCRSTFPANTGCRLVMASLGQGVVTSSLTYPMSDGEYVEDVAGSPTALTVDIVTGQFPRRHLTGDGTGLYAAVSPCDGRFTEALAYGSNGTLALCGDEPATGSQTKQLFRYSRMSGWRSLGDPGIGGGNTRLYGFGDRLLAVPVRGAVALSVDGGVSWQSVLPEVDGDAVLGWDVTEGDGEIVLLSNANDPQGRQIWRTTDGTHWTGSRIS